MNQVLPHPEPRPSRSKLWIAAGLILAGAALGWWLQQGSGKAASPAVQAVRVRVAEAVRQDVPLIIDLVGTVYPYETVAVRSRLDSQVMEVFFKDGSPVKTGDILFKLDDRALQAQVKEGQANLAKERAQLDVAQKQFERYQGLVAKGFASKEKNDELKATYETQKAVVTAAQAAIDTLRVQLDYTTIRALISGRAGTVNVTVGNTVKANDAQPLVVINQVQPVRVQVSIPQRYYDSVRDAMQSGPVAITARRETRPEEVSGVIEYIDNSIDTATGGFIARARFENQDEQLWPGMFVTTRLTLANEPDKLTVPTVAIQPSQDGDMVYLVSAENTALRRKVTVARQWQGLAVIDAGLQPGDRVLTDGLLRIKDGSPLEIIQEPAPTPEATP